MDGRHRTVIVFRVRGYRFNGHCGRVVKARVVVTAEAVMVMAVVVCCCSYYYLKCVIYTAHDHAHNEACSLSLR